MTRTDLHMTKREHTPAMGPAMKGAIHPSIKMAQGSEDLLLLTHNLHFILFLFFRIDLKYVHRRA